MKLATHPLVLIRLERGWSLADLARLMHREAARHQLRSGIDRNRIWKWEHQVEPTEEHQLLLARVLGVPAAEVEHLGWPWWLPAHADPLPFDPAGSRAAIREATTARMDRRSFLVFASSALATGAAQWATTEPGRLTGALAGQSVDPELLCWLEERTTELRGLANANGPLVAELLEIHLKTTVALIQEARYGQATGQRLHLTAAHLAQSLGWLRFDAAQHGAAQRLWQGALHAAHLAGDRDLGAGVLSDLAYTCTWLGQPKDAVRILGHARARTTSPAARSLLDLRHARALAVLRDRSGVTRALASAENELEHSDPRHAPGWVAWMSPADLSADAGRCWLDLGDQHRAAAAIEGGLSQLDPARRRTRAVFLTYQAEGDLRDKDIEAAAEHARLALDTSLDSKATRCLDLVTTLINRFERHSEPAAADLCDYARHRLAA
ncbi:helix-turn-helix domain-containing protein [Streptacidiphilus sp. EB129]|uniref:helix-turn-helix domain-containing protein n=1 Tax=Streptacidiphilus sp. EB129 TaxID=3156262 RepID=UPI00351778ED